MFLPWLKKAFGLGLLLSQTAVFADARQLLPEDTEKPYLMSKPLVSEPALNPDTNDKAAKAPSVLTWQGIHISDGWYGFKGGLQKRGGYVGNTDLRLNFNFDSIFKQKGYTALVQVQNLGSNNPNLWVNSIQGFDNYEETRVNSMTYLYQLWLQKQIKNWSILGGFYDLNAEFCVVDSAGTLMLPTMGLGTDISQSGPHGPSVYSLIGTALRVLYTPSKKTYFQAALFDAAAANPLNRIYAYPPLSSGDGLLGIYEMGYLFFNKKTAETQGRLSYGIWGYSEKVKEQFIPVVVRTGVVAHNYGMYGLIDYPVFVNPKNEANIIHAFARFGLASPYPNNFGEALQTGITINGFNNKRPKDIISFGIAPAWTSRFSRKLNPELPVQEFQAELTYAAAIGNWLVIQPDLIYLAFPKADASIYENAFLGGVRFQINIDQIRLGKGKTS